MSSRCVPVSSIPDSITSAELSLKLAHLRNILDQSGRRSILLVQEGALRWLTGMRHQVIDIAPDAKSPVSVLVMIKGSGLALTFQASWTEMARLKARIPDVFAGAGDCELDFQESMPALEEECLKPGDGNYADVVGAILRPLLGGLEGNPFAKLKWLHAHAHAALAEAANTIAVGMDGEEARAVVLRSLADRRIETNLILLSVKGQETHLHPQYDRGCRIEKGCDVKLVTGARFAEIIVSASLMVRFQKQPDEKQALAYRALQAGALEYADCYRSGALEGDIYEEVGKRFMRVEKEFGLPGFARSAYAHHLGGPTSPLGNRDYIVEKAGTRRMFPWMQFAINPVEVLYNTKIELQGIVPPDGAPLILDGSLQVPPDQLGFTRLTASGGATAMVANIVLRT